MRNQKRQIALLATAIMILTIVPAITAETAVAAEKESKLARVKLVNHAVGNRSIKNSWKKVKGAKGYEIYRATKLKGKYQKVKTINRAKTVSWTNRNLKQEKGYYYKVRAYRITDGEKEYGKFSSVQWAVPTNYPNWSYSISRKSKKTKTIKLTITNKSKFRMTFAKDGIYFKNSLAAERWDTMTGEQKVNSSNADLQAKGIYPTSMNKKYTVKPGKSITLKYKMQKAVKYQKGGYVESTFRYHKKDYGTRHSYKHGEEYWVYQ